MVVYNMLYGICSVCAVLTSLWNVVLKSWAKSSSWALLLVSSAYAWHMGDLRNRLTRGGILVEEAIHQTTPVGISYAYAVYMPDLPGFVQVSGIAPATRENKCLQSTSGRQHCICRAHAGTHFSPAIRSPIPMFCVVGFSTMHDVSICEAQAVMNAVIRAPG